MYDVIGMIVGALAIVLVGAAFAVGGQVIRDAWRGLFIRSADRAVKKPSAGEDRE